MADSKARYNLKFSRGKGPGDAEDDRVALKKKESTELEYANFISSMGQISESYGGLKTQARLVNSRNYRGVLQSFEVKKLPEGTEMKTQALERVLATARDLASKTEDAMKKFDGSLTPILRERINSAHALANNCIYRIVEYFKRKDEKKD